MHLYLPIAEMPVNALLLLALSAGVGFLSALVGVGGGFIMTPVLIFIGVPPAVAVATQASQITATSVSGSIFYWRRKAVDFRMAGLLTAGGVVGSGAGVQLFVALKKSGQVDVLITLCYVVLLGAIGGLMMRESLSALRRQRMGIVLPPKKRERTLAHTLPFRMRFPRSQLYISVLPPLAIGAAVGVLAAIMGVGGGFILVPAMIYMLRMPTSVVIGTSLVQIVAITALVTFLQAVQSHAVDLVLALLLIIGGVAGAQAGARFGAKLNAEQLRAILGLLVTLTAMKLLFDLVMPPTEIYALGATR